MTPTKQQISPEGYLPGIEINAAYARLHPRNCAVRERTADGIPVGPCSFYLENGTTCPRHGRVRGVTDPETTTTPPPQ